MLGMDKGVAKSGTPARTPKGFFCCLGLFMVEYGLKRGHRKDDWHGKCI